ncbi:hypothetical protein WOLCODRAFT_15146 [Wolfiporia cocos MD-104 SS10]|uniref:Mid2 domain-containing protein n=1 Tax=Wolfiporia cocos (strain MD-104) TaxID=742152 RepID=A0A2H3JBW2_WOLCO|nr:hypothetical protein WOLCODRAFT_15146 [Wolfiporia cocos MD-104 SS10]
MLRHLWQRSMPQLLLLLPALVLIKGTQASFSISPSGNIIQQCSQIDLMWTEQPPIHLWAAPNRDIAAGDPILHDFGVINSSFLYWTVDLCVGQNVSFTYVQESNRYVVLSSGLRSSATLINATSTSIQSSTTSLSMVQTATASIQNSTTSLSMVQTATASIQSSTSSLSMVTTTAKSQDAQVSGRSSSHAAIYGGIAGAIGLLLLVGVAALFLLRRRAYTGKSIVSFMHRDRDNSISSVSHDPASLVTPYNLQADVQSANGALATSESDRPRQEGGFVYRRLEGGPSAASRSSGLQSVSPGIPRESDAGINFTREGVPTTLPPAYQDFTTAKSH